MSHDRQFCRLCSARVQPAFALTPTPIANNYSEKPDADAKRYPLELMQCSRCHHVQQRYVLKRLFADYAYKTPATVAAHLKPVAKMLRERYPDAKHVLEIGSNNGLFLDCLHEEGFKAIGIDPANSHPMGITAFFHSGEARNFRIKFDLIVANNVLAHIDDLRDVFRGIEWLLADDGALVFEVQYLPALVEAGAFDMIYHEHMSYHSVAPLAPFLSRMGLVMTRVDYIPTHGGSIRVTAQRKGLQEWFSEKPIDWPAFTDRVNDVTKRLRAKLEGRQVVLLGAAAKVTTLLHHAGIVDRILYACDDTPQKIGRYIPGTNIQIRPTEELGEHAALLGAWNYESVWRAKFPNNEMINPFAEEVVCA